MAWRRAAQSSNKDHFASKTDRLKVLALGGAHGFLAAHPDKLTGLAAEGSVGLPITPFLGVSGTAGSTFDARQPGTDEYPYATLAVGPSLTPFTGAVTPDTSSV